MNEWVHEALMHGTHLSPILVISPALPAIMINCLFSHSVTITEPRKPLHFDAALQKVFILELSANTGKSCYAISSGLDLLGSLPP